VEATEQLRPMLAAMPLFAQLSEEIHTAILAEASLVHLPAGHWLFRQGDPGDALYVIASGRLEVVRETPAPAAIVRQLGRGAAIGELALLTGSARSASARAVRDTELVAIRREEMLGLLHDSPPFAIELTRALGRLLLATEPPPRPPAPPSVLALVPLQPDAPAGPLCDALLDALRPWARVSMIRREDLPSDGEGDERFAGHGRLLDERERAHDYVVLFGGPGEADDAWNAFCVRQADRVVAVGAARPPPPSRGRHGLPRGCELVLWGPLAEARQVIGGWLAALEPRRHHFVQTGPDLPESAARTARRLVGRSIGVVLSGGGAGGLAHLGVLATLMDGGVTVDRVGGCSFGAFIGALLAMGCSPEEMIAICREELVRRNPFNDYTVPRRALLRGKKGEQALRRLFGATRIEELPLDYFCVTADLLTAETVVHRRGTIVDGVRASMSVPGIGPPVPRGERLLVDGGVLNNLPVDVMAADEEGPVIAVDVMRKRLRPEELAPLAQSPPGREPPVLAIHETLSRASVLGSWSVGERNRAQAQLVISPDARGIGFFEFRRMDEIMSAGRRAAEAALEDALALAPVSSR
jgi:NTE family protein